MSAESLDERVILITGGNAGIGKATAIELARRGARVVFTARDPERARQAMGEINEKSVGKVSSLLLDLASFASIRIAAEEFTQRYERLDVLINNAGAVPDERQTTADGFEMTLGVNHLGHFLLTKLLLPTLKDSAPSRIVNVTSQTHWMAAGGLNLNDLQSEKSFNELLVYARSKLANLLFTKELAKRLAGTGVTANAVHPGTVVSGFAMDGDTAGILNVFHKVGDPLITSSEHGARASVYCAVEPSLVEVTGEYFVRSEIATPSPAARNEEAARKLWELSELWIEQGHP